MLMNVDKFFVKELQDRGIDVDYKKLLEIYQASRKHPGCIRRKKQREIEDRVFRQYLELENSRIHILSKD